MYITLTIPWKLIDATHGFPHPHVVAPGRYELERVENPFGYSSQPWFVLRGTKIGGGEAFWRLMSKKYWGDFRVIFDQSVSVEQSEV